MQPQTDIKKWLWLIYPAIAFGFIVFSLNFLLSLPSSDIDGIMRSAQKIESEEAIIERLQQKQTQLQKLKTTDLNDDLKEVVVAVPPSKKMWLLVAETRAAIDENKALLDNYQGAAGDVREATGAALASDVLQVQVTVGVDNFRQLSDIIANLEKQLPLIKVVDVSFDVDEAKLILEGAWSAWGKVGAVAETPLPDYETNLLKVKQWLNQFKTNSVGEAASSSGEGESNPF